MVSIEQDFSYRYIPGSSVDDYPIEEQNDLYGKFFVRNEEINSTDFFFYLS